MRARKNSSPPARRKATCRRAPKRPCPRKAKCPKRAWKNCPKRAKLPTEEPVDVPKTGDSVPSVGLALLFGLAACAVVLKKARTR